MNKFVKVILVIDLILVNVGVGYLAFLKFESRNTNFETNTNIQNTNITPQPPLNLRGGDNTDQDLAGLELRVKNLESKAKITPVPTQKATVVAAPARTKVRTVQYVTIPGSGSNSTNSWVSLSGTDFYFDTSDYPGLTEIYFEASLKLFNGNGMAYVRLLDVTHGIGVQGSDISSGSQQETLLASGRVTFWAGKNLIRVQAKSLTADTAVYTNGRLKIITVN